jgi:hypothetical protein
VLVLICDHFTQNLETWLIAQLGKLLLILHDVVSFIDLQPPQSKINPSFQAHERLGSTVSFPAINGLRTSKRTNSTGPEVCVVFFRRGKPSHYVSTPGVQLLGGETLIRGAIFHFCLPIGLKGGEQTRVPFALEHAASLCRSTAEIEMGHQRKFGDQITAPTRIPDAANASS